MPPKKTATKSTIRAKKPWVTPKIKTGRLFESNSLACGKNSPNDECNQNPKLS